MPLILIGLLTGLVSFTAVAWVRRRAIAQNLLDVPNERSLHQVPTPRGGGLAILVAFTLGALAYSLMAKGTISVLGPLMLGALPVAMIGWVDDRGHVPPQWRALVHFGSSFAAVSAFAFQRGFGPDLPHLFFEGPAGLFAAILIASLLAAYVLNVYNFMDGIDGLAGAEGVFVGLAAALLLGGALPRNPLGTASEASQLAGILAISCFGFLLWNWPPAKIFMGDVGSGFIGFTVAVLALTSAVPDPRVLYAWFILLAAFLADGTFTLAVRFATRQKWYEAHNLHAFQKAARRFRGHRPVLVAILLIDVVWLLPLAAAALRDLDRAWIYALVAYLPLFALAAVCRAGFPEASQSATTSLSE